MYEMPRLRAGLPGLTALAAALLLAACNPAPPPSQGGDGGGSGGGGGTVVCNSNQDCPSSTPVCSGGVCVSKANAGCTSDAQCDGGTCDTLTGQCTSGSGPGTDGGGGGGTACQTANDCQVNQICKSGTCQPYDANVACASNADCPRDHLCNALGGGTCQGCLNDNSCVGSPNGPKCDTGTSGGPGQGYCYKQCGPGVSTACPTGTVCDTTKGGLCVPACQSNTDCTGGLVCHGGQCQACTADSQCDPSQVCSSGTCVTKSGCTAASCQNLGQAYYCDSGSGTCQLGCTASGCTGATKDCNPCQAGQTCDTTSHTCSGGTTCNNCQASGGCTSTQTCNTTTCTCVTPGGGGGGGTGQIGDPCLQDSDCATQTGKTIGCYGAIASIGFKGTCQEICDQKTLCLCSGTKQCYNSLGSIVLCALGATGECQ